MIVYSFLRSYDNNFLNRNISQIKYDHVDTDEYFISNASYYFNGVNYYFNFNFNNIIRVVLTVWDESGADVKINNNHIYSYSHGRYIGWLGGYPSYASSISRLEGNNIINIGRHNPMYLKVFDHNPGFINGQNLLNFWSHHPNRNGGVIFEILYE